MIKLFNELSSLERSMEMSAVMTSVDELNALDERYLKLWDEIFEFQPETDDMAELMLLMLMDKLEEAASRKETCIQIREKILSLFQTTDLRKPAEQSTAEWLKPVRGIA